MTQWIIVEDITVNSFGVKHLPVFRTFKTSEEAYDYCEESLIPEMIDELHEWVGDDTIFDLQDDHIDRKYWYSYIDYLGNRIQGEIRVQPVQVEAPE